MTTQRSVVVIGCDGNIATGQVAMWPGQREIPKSVFDCGTCGAKCDGNVSFAPLEMTSKYAFVIHCWELHTRCSVARNPYNGIALRICSHENEHVMDHRGNIYVIKINKQENEVEDANEDDVATVISVLARRKEQQEACEHAKKQNWCDFM